jgi:hypothetical protein
MAYRFHMLKLNYHRIHCNRDGKSGLIGLTFMGELDGDNREFCSIGRRGEFYDVLIFRGARQQFNVSGDFRVVTLT